MRELAKKELAELDKLTHLTEREKVIREALSHVGYTEQENNDNQFGHYFEFNNVAWCGFFCHYCYLVGAAIQCPSTNKGRKGMAYVPSALSIFEKDDCLTKDPEPGDLVIFDFPGGVKADHIGIFHKWKVKGVSYYCIEGNTSQRGHQSNGGAVEYQIRTASLAKAFVSLDKIKEKGYATI